MRNRRPTGADVKACGTLGVESVPDGLANGLLAGVNPAYELYAYIVGTAVGDELSIGRHTGGC